MGANGDVPKEECLVSILGHRTRELDIPTRPREARVRQQVGVPVPVGAQRIAVGCYVHTLLYAESVSLSIGRGGGAPGLTGMH